jgi:hypothetical protein
MSQVNVKPPDSKSSEKTGKDVVIAIISGIVTVIVALLGADAIWNHILVTPTPPAVVAGINSPASTAMNTPLPSVVVAPTETYQPGVLAPGEDWKEDCIQSQQWKIYPEVTATVDGKGCYEQPVWQSMYTRDEGLSIFAQPKALISSEEYGFFTQLPQRGTVSISVDLDKINNGQVWFAIFSEPDIHGTDGILLVAPPGDVKNQAFALKRLLPNNTEKDIVVSRVYNNASGVYSLGFNLQFGSITAVVEDDFLTPIPFTPITRWLFIGYRAKLNTSNGTADIEALFSNLEIK